MKLFVDLDETLVHTLYAPLGGRPEAWPEDRVPDYEFDLGGFRYSVFVRQDIDELIGVPFSILTHADRDYAEMVADFLKREKGLWIEEVFTTREAGSETVLYDGTCILIDEADAGLIRNKLAMLPNCKHLMVHAWDLDRAQKVPRWLPSGIRALWMRKARKDPRWTIRFIPRANSMTLRDALRIYESVVEVW